MKTKIGILWTAVVFSSFALISSQTLAADGDPVAGKDKAAACGGCHGEDGNSPSAEFPRLAGQYAGYITKQIADFQNSIRTNNETMAGMAATIASVQDAKDIAAYFSKQKMAAQPIDPPKQELVAKGEKIFNEGNAQNGVYACVNCHGKNGKGKADNISIFPIIGGQHRDYIIKELKDFREGKRTNDPAGMMSDVAKKLSDQEIEAVANYLSAQ